MNSDQLHCIVGWVGLTSTHKKLHTTNGRNLDDCSQVHEIKFCPEDPPLTYEGLSSS